MATQKQGVMSFDKLDNLFNNVSTGGVPFIERFNKNNRSINELLGTNGETAFNASYDTSEYIKTTLGTCYIDRPRRVCIYDENKTLIECIDNPSQSAIFIEVGTGYIRTSFFNTLVDDSSIIITNNKLYKKTILNLGDSIAFGSNNSGKGYADLISERNGMIVYDYSASGATMADNTSTEPTRTYIKNKYEQFKTENPTLKPDFILLEGYANDITLSTLGSITADYTSAFQTTEYYGALEDILKQIKIDFPESKLIYITPHNMGSRVDSTQKNFYNATIEVLLKWSVQLVDLYSYCGLNTWIPSMLSTYTDTGTHPNQKGYNVFYIPMIEYKMNSI